MSIVGKIKITTSQAEKLQLGSRKRRSPYLEKCCLLIASNQSYQRGEEDLEKLTGIKVSHSTLQRMVVKEEWSEIEVSEEIEEISLDGGMVRLRTPLKESSEWREYKAININNHLNLAFFKDNESLLSWLNSQPLAKPLSCLGDGHDGVWNIFAQVGKSEEREEILDWYHLMENLHKVTGAKGKINRVKNHLWWGEVGKALSLLKKSELRGADRFSQYLKKHEKRIINYCQKNLEGETIGSGAVESLVKQIGLRVKISGAQWSRENVPQILRLRCAYLNGVLTA
jgi:hypothetical protein